MNGMFYVLYSPSRKQYVDEDGNLTGFNAAEQFDEMYFTPSLDDVKWVGPCKEGEEP